MGQRWPQQINDGSYSPVDMDLTLNQHLNGSANSGNSPISYTIWANNSGTPTVLQTSPITYTSGGSSSTTVTITIIDNVASISYSLDEIIETLGVPISPHSNPTNTGGAVVTWEISPDPGPHFHFNTANGIISGTPGALLTRTQYTIYGNNSGGSSIAYVNVTINDAAPDFYYGISGGSQHFVRLVVNATINPVVPNHRVGGGMPTSCTTSPSLPTGLSISSSCVITGTPTVLSSYAWYTVTASNSGGTSSFPIINKLFIGVFAEGGTLTVTPTATEGIVNSTISDITMSYSHSASNYGWTSGVTNGSSILTGNFHYGGGSHWLGIDSGEQGEMAVVYAHNDTGATTHSLGLMYLWDGVWTEYLLDNDTDTGQHPSVAIDRQGALHIAYIDTHNDKLRYATNATGTWAFTTLGDAIHNSVGRGTYCRTPNNRFCPCCYYQLC